MDDLYGLDSYLDEQELLAETAECSGWFDLPLDGDMPDDDEADVVWHAYGKGIDRDW